MGLVAVSEVGWPHRVWRRWTWPVVTVVSLLPLGAHASPTIAQPSNPQQITDGNAVPECAWPSVVALYSGDGTIERCSGFYIGGRVVLTAAHCVPRGFRVPPVTPTCQNDSDCPDEDPFGESLDLVCPAAGSDFCEDPDATKSNGIEAAQFGEVYLSPELDGHIRRSVDIEYCRRRTDDSDDDVAGTSNDIAYCILRATPNVQPVPLAMHCEAEQFLSENTQVTAVGFGQADPDIGFDSGGIKRSATASLGNALGANTETFIVGSSGWNPGPPISGDSGGPLFVQVPDGTWRAIGVASTNAVEYVTPWPHVAWILDDPEGNVAADAIIPCHDENGEWEPKAGCGEFPASPASASGSWGRGPMACFDADVGGPSETCATPGGTSGGVGTGDVDVTGDPTMGVLDSDAPAGDEQAPPTTGCACRASPGRSTSPIATLAIMVLLGTGRSRRRRVHCASRVIALAVTAALLAGCPGNGGGTGTGTDTDGGTGADTGPPPGPPPIDPNNPDYRGILGGVDPEPTIDYESLAVGNITQPASSTQCCQDYVVASPSRPTVRVLFSQDLPGIPFLADIPDELVDVGGVISAGVDDVLLADLDGDDRNDLVALRTDGNVVVVPGIAGPPGGPFFDTSTLIVSSAGAASGSFALSDLDCDGVSDLAATAPAGDGFVFLAGDGTGAFNAFPTVSAGSAPQDVALADVNGDSEADVAVSNDNGSFSVALNSCDGAFTGPDTYELFSTDTFGMPIATGELCPGHPGNVAVAVGIFDIVYVTCGDGTGDFADVVEPHGEQVEAPYDYFWDPSPGNVTANLIADLFVWHPGSALYALRSRPVGTSEVVWLPPDTTQANSEGGRIIAQLRGGDPFSEGIVHGLGADASTWNRVSFVGQAGLGVAK